MANVDKISLHSAALQLREPDGKCTCEAEGIWKKPNRTSPICLFIDLGAHTGDTFDAFYFNLSQSTSKHSLCHRGTEWQAVLVEANPELARDIAKVKAHHPDRVTVLAPTAAYICNTMIRFWKRGLRYNFLNAIHPFPRLGWQYAGLQGAIIVPSLGAYMTAVMVPAVNVVQMLADHALPEDYVILKVDVEGAEYDILPCLAQSQHSRLVDVILMEEHPYKHISSQQLQIFHKAKEMLIAANVSIVPWH